MTADDNKLRAAMARHLDDLHPRVSSHQIVRQAGRARLLTTMSSLVIGGVLVASTAVVLSNVNNNDATQPVAPGTSPSAEITPAPSESPSRETNGCPLTIPPQPAFVPPEPYPPQAPDLYQRVWYGTAELWTMIDPNGVILEALPDDDGNRTYRDKSFWWSEDYPARTDPSPTFTLAGRQLDGSGSFEESGPAGGGYRKDIGNFILTGIEIPPGCWELTATYRGAELSYVVLVKA